MFKIKVPYLETYMEKDSAVILSDFRIHSSILEPVPIASFKLTLDTQPVDGFNVVIGSEFAVDAVFAKESTTTSETDETASSDLGDTNDLWKEAEPLANLVVSELEYKAEESSAELTYYCTGELGFYQNSDIRTCYKNKNASEIVDDVVSSNSTMNEYDTDSRDFEESDNDTTVYRVLGDTDLDFICNTISKNFTICNGTPLFYTGLDSTLHFTSINQLIQNNTKAHYVIYCSGMKRDDFTDAEAQIPTYIKSNADSDYVELTASSFQLSVGKNQSYASLKESVYYTQFIISNGLTYSLDFTPASKGDATYYPVLGEFLNNINSFRARSLVNRPAQNIVYESRGLSKAPEDIISIKVVISGLAAMDKLILAGDSVVVFTKNYFSMYNGVYIVQSVDIIREQQADRIELVLVRSYLDKSFADLIDSSKDSDDFQTYYSNITKPAISSLFKV